MMQKTIFNFSRIYLTIFSGVLFWVCERYLEGTPQQWVWRLVAAVLFVLGVVATSILIKKSENVEEKKSWFWSAIWQGFLGLGVLFFYLYKHLMGVMIVPESFLQKITLAFYLFCVLAAVLLLITLELTRVRLGLAVKVESKRLKASFFSGLSLSFLTGTLIALNYSAAKVNKSRDFSYLKTNEASESTLKMVNTLEEPMEVFIFFSKNSEVLPFVEPYFNILAQKESKVHVQVVDKDLDPGKAESLKVTTNGQVILEFKGKRERIDFGQSLSSARSAIKKIDSRFQSAFLSLTSEQKVAYFTRGHGEASWTAQANQSRDRQLSLLENLLRDLNYSIRYLGLGDGLAKKVPDDAAIVFIVGPQESFSPEEANSIKNYLDKNGKVFLFLDLPQSKELAVKRVKHDPNAPADPLLKVLASTGIKFYEEILANDSDYVVETRSDADRVFLYTNSFSTHESVANLARNDERVALVANRLGRLGVTPQMGTWKAEETVRSLANTFNDLNRNYKFDKDSETKNSYAIGAVAIGQHGSKLAVATSASLIGDKLIRNPANALFAVETMKWLVGDLKIGGEIAQEEDKKIQHTRKQNVVWFWGTVGVVPALILMAGFFATRRKGRG